MGCLIIDSSSESRRSIRIVTTAKTRHISQSLLSPPPIEIIEAETKANIDGVNEYRTVLIDFVRSERYVEISEHGIQ